MQIFSVEMNLWFPISDKFYPFQIICHMQIFYESINKSVYVQEFVFICTRVFNCRQIFPPVSQYVYVHCTWLCPPVCQYVYVHFKWIRPPVSQYVYVHCTWICPPVCHYVYVHCTLFEHLCESMNPCISVLSGNEDYCLGGEWGVGCWWM